MKNALKISPPRAGIFSFPLFPGILKTNENRKTRKGSDLMVTSAHYACERAEREKRIEHINGGDGEEVARFLVDRHHPAGPEIHVVTSNAIIVIYNAFTGKLVTKLVARPGQIKRYYDAKGLTAPQYLLDIARVHKERGWNY